jgi:hypothetical protein
MPDWQAELTTLLAELHVSLDSVVLANPDGADTVRHSHSNGALGVAPADSMDAELPWELGALTAEEVPDDGDEVSAVQSEIEATVTRVVALARAGRMDTALCEDVVFVLQALTRPIPRSASLRTRSKKQAESHQEWQLASAAAVLRFCRIVLSLTNALAGQGNPQAKR